MWSAPLFIFGYSIVTISLLGYLPDGVSSFWLILLSSLICQNTKHYRNEHIWQGVTNDNIYPHQKSVNHKAHKPDNQIADVECACFLVLFQNKEIGNLDGDHRCEHGANEIQKIGYISKRQEDCTNCTDDGYCKPSCFAV